MAEGEPPANSDKPAARPEDMAVPTRCTSCGSSHLTRDYERGELVCDECGLVLEESMIDQGPDWRAFDAEQGEKRARTGAPTTLTIHDKGLSTEIGWKNRDPYGKSIPTAQPRPALPPPEVAAADPRLQRDRAQPRVRPRRARPDRLRDGASAERPRDRGDDLPKGGQPQPHPRSLDRGRRRGLPLRQLPPVQRAADARRDRVQVADRSEGDRTNVPVHDPRAAAQAHADPSRRTTSSGSAPSSS